jgi:hypothetical protein
VLADDPKLFELERPCGLTVREEPGNPAHSLPRARVSPCAARLENS